MFDDEVDGDDKEPPHIVNDEIFREEDEEEMPIEEDNDKVSERSNENEDERVKAEI